MDTLKAILVDSGIPEAAIRKEALLYGNLQLDSVETVRLALELKRRMGIDIKLGTRNDMTLAEICNLIETSSPTHAS